MLKKSLLLALMVFASFASAQAEITIKSAEPIEKNSKKETLTNKENTINLSEEKRKEVEKITNEHNQQLTQLKPKIKDKTKALKNELTKDNLDIIALESLNKELFILKEQEQLIRLKYQVALSKVLTTEERKSLNKMSKAKASPQKAKK